MIRNVWKVFEEGGGLGGKKKYLCMMVFLHIKIVQILVYLDLRDTEQGLVRSEDSLSTIQVWSSRTKITTLV